MLPAPTVEIDAQYRALREEAGMLERDDVALLSLAGAEAAEFLQGQLTNEVEALAPGAGCYALLLDRKGHVRAELRVLREAERILLLTPASCADEVERHLTTYKIGREVEVERQASMRLLSLIGPRAAELLGGPLPAEDDHRLARIAEADCTVVGTDAGADLIVAAGDVEPVAEALSAAGAESVEERAVEIVRVERGRPAFGREFGHETIPQEAGLNERAVSFGKGCYIGQETVARLHYRGKPNRHLRRLRSELPLESGAEVRLGERALGEIGTAVISPAEGPLALAVLRREAGPGDEVEVGEGIPALVEEIAG